MLNIVLKLKPFTCGSLYNRNMLQKARQMNHQAKLIIQKPQQRRHESIAISVTQAHRLKPSAKLNGLKSSDKIKVSRETTGLVWQWEIIVPTVDKGQHKVTVGWSSASTSYTRCFVHSTNLLNLVNTEMWKIYLAITNDFNVFFSFVGLHTWNQLLHQLHSISHAIAFKNTWKHTFLNSAFT